MAAFEPLNRRFGKKKDQGIAYSMNLTTQEKKVLGFLLVLALLGGGVLAYRALFEKRVSSPSRWSMNSVPTYSERKTH